MPKKLLAPLTPKKSKRTDNVKGGNVPNAMYSGITNTRAFLQQSRSSKAWYNSPLKREDDCVTCFSQENMKQSAVHHAWKPEYSKLVLREKFVKPMTKDPYTYKNCSQAQAVERIVTETECQPALIPATSVNKKTVTIHIAPKPAVPNVIRYMRRGEPMPAGRLLSTSNSTMTSTLGQIDHQRGIKSNVNNDRVNMDSRNLTTPGRLLNRPQIRNEGSVIRRPPRRLITNITQETILPVSVYG